MLEPLASQLMRHLFAFSFVLTSSCATLDWLSIQHPTFTFVSGLLCLLVVTLLTIDIVLDALVVRSNLDPEVFFWYGLLLLASTTWFHRFEDPLLPLQLVTWSFVYGSISRLVALS
jgi:hypothetical protein